MPLRLGQERVARGTRALRTVPRKMRGVPREGEGVSRLGRERPTEAYIMQKMLTTIESEGELDRMV